MSVQTRSSLAFAAAGVLALGGCSSEKPSVASPDSRV